MPKSAELAVASKNADGSFTRLSNSDAILQTINSVGDIVYIASPSPDGLVIAFNGSASYGQPDPTARISISIACSRAIPRSSTC